MVIPVSNYGAFGLRSDGGKEFKVNGQRLKHYLRGDILRNESIMRIN